MEKSSKIYVAGHTGLVGSALCSALARGGYSAVITRTHGELDLCDQAATHAFFESEKPEYVFHAAAKVGGIAANDTYPADFIMENLKIQTNVIDASFRYGIKRLLFMGSNCIYPKACVQPVKEEYLLSGPLELTNEAFAIAKIAGVKTCYYLNKQYNKKFIAVMGCNLYGPGDNFDLENSHVLPALLRRMHEAKLAHATHVVLWGTGRPKREFLFKDDLADACVFLMNHYGEDDPVNIGYGEDISIAELAQVIKSVVGYTGDIVFDPSRPDGTERKLLDCSRINKLGWQPKVSLQEGIEATYAWYLQQAGKA